MTLVTPIRLYLLNGYKKTSYDYEVLGRLVTEVPIYYRTWQQLHEATVWIDLLRGHRSAPVVMLKRLLELGEAAVAPVIVQELLQGASSPNSLARLRTHFLALPVLEPKPGAVTHADAGELYARCRWAGITPRSPHDCLIATLAVQHGVPLLHDDKDFEAIAGVGHRLIPTRG